MTRLPVLMYHHVSLTQSAGLTISLEKLETQLKWLSENGYRSFHFSELEALKTLPKKKNIIITFDDAYVSQMELAVPLLQKYKLKATFFVPLQYLGKTDEWNTASNPIMTVPQLRSLDPKTIELGYHSFYHKKYHELSENEIRNDSRKCFETIAEHQLKFSPVLAYPYGKYPRATKEKQAFFKLLQKDNFKYGLRIGNRLNKFPFKEPFEIQRLDIKGEYSLAKFQRKVKYGKLF